MENTFILDTELLQPKTIEFLPTMKKRSTLAISNQVDCCVTVDTGNVNIQWIPGYNGQSFVAVFISHHILPVLMTIYLLCKYG